MMNVRKEEIPPWGSNQILLRSMIEKEPKRKKIVILNIIYDFTSEFGENWELGRSDILVRIGTFAESGDDSLILGTCHFHLTPSLIHFNLRPLSSQRPTWHFCYKPLPFDLQLTIPLCLEGQTAKILLHEDVILNSMSTAILEKLSAEF